MIKQQLAYRFLLESPRRFTYKFKKNIMPTQLLDTVPSDAGGITYMHFSKLLNFQKEKNAK